MKDTPIQPMATSDPKHTDCAVRPTSSISDVADLVTALNHHLTNCHAEDDAQRQQKIATLYSLGNAYETLGGVSNLIKASAQYTQALAELRSLYGAIPPSEEAKILIGLCSVHHALGGSENIKKMTAYAEEAYALLIQSNTAPDSLSAIFALATSYSNMEGDEYASKALDLLNIAHEVAEQIYHGANNQITGIINNLISNIYYKRGALDDTLTALTYATKALKIFLTLEPLPSDEVANAYCNIGLIHKKIGDSKPNESTSHYEQNVICQEKATAAFENLYGDHPHPNLAKCLSNYADALICLGRAEDFTLSYSLADRALDINLALYSPDHPFVLRCLETLQTLSNIHGTTTVHPHDDEHYNGFMNLYNAGRELILLDSATAVTKGIAKLLKALPICNNYYDSLPNINTSKIQYSIGYAYYKLGGSENLLSSLTYHLAGLKHQQAYYGLTDHIDIADSLTSLSSIYGALGGPGADVKRLEYAEQSLAMRQRLLVTHEPDEGLIKSMLSAAAANTEMGDSSYNSRALAILDDAYMYATTLYKGEPHHIIADVLSAKSKLYQTIGGITQLYEAIMCEKISYDIYEQLSLAPHSAMADQLITIGLIHQKLAGLKPDLASEHYIISLAYLIPAVEMLREVCGNEQHLSLANSLRELSHVYLLLGGCDNNMRGIKLLKDALDQYLSILPDEDPIIMQCKEELQELVASQSLEPPASHALRYISGQHTTDTVINATTIVLTEQKFDYDNHIPVAGDHLNNCE